MARASRAVYTASGCGDVRDGTALLGLREAVKLVHNLTLQGNPVGDQDETTPCPHGGQARTFGTADSNAEQGTIEVRLKYELEECSYLRRDEDADENYDLATTGMLEQEGILAVQPNETTALIMRSDSLSLEGFRAEEPHALAKGHIPGSTHR